MATTTNFGWETPDDTDLVKDGAAAIRTLGQSIDTSLMDLEGGTTGQILSKNSKTDMDFVWVTSAGDIEGVTAGTGISGGGTSGTVTITNSMATAIDAKGDLVAGTGADAFSRLAVGANNTVLTADSTAATGLKWATPVAAGKSYTLINTGGSAISGAITYTYSGLSGYDSYLVQVIGASSTQGNLQIYLTFNGDTAANYGVTGFRVENNSTWSADVVNPLGSLTNGRLAFGTASGNQTSTVSGGCTILGANTSGAYKIVNVVGGGNWTSGNGNALYVYNGFWKNTATISSISVSTEAGTLDAGTLYIYGAA